MPQAPPARRRRAVGSVALLVLGLALGACGSSSPAPSGPAGTLEVGTTAPRATPSPGPRLALSASTGLADLQEVEVEGSGFEPGSTLVVVVCGPGSGLPADSCQGPGWKAYEPREAYPLVDPGGGFSATVVVRSTLYLPSGGALVDCLEGGCRLAAVDTADFADVVAEVPLVFDRDAAGGLDRPEPPGGCPAPHGPYSSTRFVSGDPGEPTVEALTPDGVEGEEQPYPSLDATVRVLPLADALQVEVVIDGVVRTFTTAPEVLGGHYPSRSGGGPAETPFGTFNVVVEPDGTRDVVLRRASSGDYSAYAWPFDDPCATG